MKLLVDVREGVTPGSEPLVPLFAKAGTITDWRRVKELCASVELVEVVPLVPLTGLPVASNITGLPYMPLDARCLKLGRAEAMEIRTKVVKAMSFIASRLSE